MTSDKIDEDTIENVKNSTELLNNSTVNMKIDHSLQKYPYCIVWSPLPVISWFFPFIGHTGIGSSNGMLYDFAGPYSIGVGRLAFGAPTRYIQLDPAKCYLKDWDGGVEEGCSIYSGRMHNLCCDNCHSHVAQCLNSMGYGKSTHYEMIRICFWVFFQGKFVNTGAFVKTYLPFCMIVLIFVILSSIGYI
mmetsp:Transcript_9066/g.13506  ORF Transcript_9066/g.13506 Transcript_9066/m.13506 type:complete len:190 (+) Transcript_9066:163-732(+)